MLTGHVTKLSAILFYLKTLVDADASSMETNIHRAKQQLIQFGNRQNIYPLIQTCIEGEEGEILSIYTIERVLSILSNFELYQYLTQYNIIDSDQIHANKQKSYMEYLIYIPPPISKYTFD